MRSRLILLQQTPTVSPTTVFSSTPRLQSPVPYLFAGLAAMLGLIAFALLVLACSYWRLSDRDEEEEEGTKSAEEEFKVSPVLEEKVLVIMAGEGNPTYIATPRLVCCTCQVKGQAVEERRKRASSGEEEQEQDEGQDKRSNDAVAVKEQKSTETEGSSNNSNNI